MATEEIFVDQILPTIATADSECIQNVIRVMESLYRTEIGGPTPPTPRQECATNCVLTVRHNKNCNTSVLLLQGVFHEEAIEFLSDLRDVQTELCTIGLECCGMSQPLPPICQDCKYINLSEMNYYFRCPSKKVYLSVPYVHVISIYTDAHTLHIIAQPDPVVSEGQVGETILIGAVLGGVFGVVLVGGTVVIVILVVACLIVYLSRRKQKTSFVE